MPREDVELVDGEGTQTVHLAGERRLADAEDLGGFALPKAMPGELSADLGSDALVCGLLDHVETVCMTGM